MTDLISEINNTRVADMQVLYTKYAPLYEFIKDKKQIPFLTVVIDRGIAYVKENHADLPLDWKVWSIIYLKHKYLKGLVKRNEDISECIADFIKHYKTDYAEYIEQIGTFRSEFDRDYGFVCKYI